MIIGINGYIHSGKDTTGSIIQYLTTPKKEQNYTGIYNSFIMDMGMGYEPWWEIKKYAYKLKQIASILTGIPIEKFEDQEFKKTYLPEIWDKWAIREETYGDIIKYFATEEEAVVYREQMYKEAEEGDYTICNFITKIRMTVRLFLQLLGTEAMRDVIHPQVWINALFADYVHEPVGKPYNEQGERVLELPNWIITDCRFENEAQAIKDRGGIVIRVDRKESAGDDPIQKMTSIGQSYWVTSQEKHASETGLDNWDFDWIVDNNSDIDYLVKEVEKMIRNFNILT